MASSKLRNATADQEAECALDMSPMIDMVFLLLIFFIVNATAIIVKTDPEIEPPVAANSKRQEDGSGRIVVNVREDGTFTAEDFNTILAGEDEIYDYVNSQKDQHLKVGVTPKLHLRGDKDAVFRHSRTAVRGSARAGVDQVVFAVFVKDPNPNKK
jgi:biopolymer transport protein ExbD